MIEFIGIFAGTALVAGLAVLYAISRFDPSEIIARAEQRRFTRGTLTILPSGALVIGMPGDRSPEEVADLSVAVAAWLKAGINDLDKRSIVFPWPVDIVDMRRDR